MNSDVENATRCMNLLIEAVGHVDAERFIAYFNRKGRDYTEWRRQFYDGMTSEEIDSRTAAHMKEHPIPDDVRKRIEAYRKENPYDKSVDTGDLRCEQ